MFSRLLAVFALAGAIAFAQEIIPEQMTVTVDAAHGKIVPDVKRGDVLAFEGKDRLTVSNWTALTGDRAALELYIMIDDATASSIGNQFADLRQFIDAQPATTQIGVAYMHYDSAEIVQPLSADHNKAAQALRIPIGSIAAGTSPYIAVNDLIKKWPASNARHEVLLISSGIDPIGGIGPINQFVDGAIEHAQRAGVIVYGIYMPIAGLMRQNGFAADWGQNHLLEFTEASGGETYMLAFGAPVSFAPYLHEIEQHLLHQYSIEFRVAAPGHPEFVPIKFTTETPGAKIIAAPRVYVMPAHAGT